eukprot:1148519-Pelagomonas_calceolata.AAC.6
MLHVTSTEGQCWKMCLATVPPSLLRPLLACHFEDFSLNARRLMAGEVCSFFTHQRGDNVQETLRVQSANALTHAVDFRGVKISKNTVAQVLARVLPAAAHHALVLKEWL